MAIKGKHPTTNKQAPSNGKLSLAGSDFVFIEEPRLQTNAVIFGVNGQGKTTTVTEYCPEPIAFISLDRRGERAVDKAKKKGRTIAFLKVDTPVNPTKLDDTALRKVGQTALNQIIKNFEWAVNQSLRGNIKTIGMDTGTEYAEIVNFAVTGRADRVKGDYGKSKDLINREFWRLYNLAREGNAHFVMLARAQEIWIANEPTGTFKPRGPDVISDAADWCGNIRLKRRSKGRAKKEFELEITKAGVNIDELGEVYDEEAWGDMGPFGFASWMQFIDTSERKDWKW